MKSDEFRSGGRTFMDSPAERDRWLRSLKPVVITQAADRASGLPDSEVIGWDRFLAAWFKDFDARSLDPPSIEALKIFILTWVLAGKPSATVEMRVGERDDDVQYHTIEEVPAFSYNPEKVKDIGRLFMTYGQWKGAVGDFKLNTQGPSNPALFGKAEQASWGGPIDISQDVKLPQIGGAADLDKFLGRD